jgi:dethiobiotin synthetase
VSDSSLPSDKACLALLVIGTEFGCGKTVLMCSIAGALREIGFAVRVRKPLILCSRKAAEAELAFLASIGQSPVDYQVRCAEGPISHKETNWHNVVTTSFHPDYVTLIEMPGGASTPVCYEENNSGTLSNRWRDCVDMAKEFGYPCLVVAKHQSDVIDRLVMTCSYVAKQEIKMLACATVEVVQDGGVELEKRRTRADFTVGLASRVEAPYLGCIKFSPSISVPRVNQGNLIKMAAGLDLLPLIKALNLAVPTF